MKKTNIPKIAAKKKRGEKIVMLTCYDATFAKILDETNLDMLLVGDSLGMVIQGHKNTLPVTMEETLYHTRCVSRVAKNTPVVADLPFLSYQISKEQAVLNAGRCLKEGMAEAVKIEGGMEQIETVKALIQANIPVMGHIGLKPQSIHQMGGYKIQGKTESSIKALFQEAQALEEAGCFAIVLEGVVASIAKQITERVSIPTIGIASGSHCDGQVLVIYDLLGMDPGWQPKFAKRYLEGHQVISQAVSQFIQEVQSELFPQEEQERTPEELRIVK